MHSSWPTIMVGMAKGKGTPTPEQGKEAPTQDQTSQSKPWTLKEVGGKPVWDWMQLLIVPLAVAVIGILFTWQQDVRQQEIEDQRSQDAALRAYLEQMNQLLLERDLRGSEEGSEERILARAQTLTVLDELDPSRREQVMRFLMEAELVQGLDAEGPIILPRQGIDIRTPVISLAQANLEEVNLSGAQLQGADLNNANLRDATLIDADLRAANLIAANLRNANLGTGPDRTSGTILSGADLTLADLSNANLDGAQGTTKEQLDRAASLQGATMPDGSEHP
jgi:pentapeptide repeat protein